MSDTQNRLRIYNKRIKSLYGYLGEAEEEYTFYELTFQNLTDLYAYLKSDPEVNSKIFRRLSSQKSDTEFSGVSYETALNYIISGYSENYDKYLTIKKQLDKTIPTLVDRREPIKSVAGSRPNVTNFIAGVPKNMYKLQRMQENKFVTIHFNLSYSHVNTPEQIRNRGNLTLNLIKLLELNGYKVKLNTFFLMHEYNEIIYIKLNLKKHGELINERKCYYPMCSREFLRRIAFRIMESVPIENYAWGESYGKNLCDDSIRSVLGISDNDILINSPNHMDIMGFSIEEDAENFINNAGIKGVFETKILKK